jgi:uncharacterized protein YkwD
MLQVVVALSFATLVAAPTAGASHFDGLLAPSSACPGQEAADSAASHLRGAAVCLHNHARGAGEDRSRRGNRPLGGSHRLRRSAAAKAEDVLRCGELSHTACGRDVFHWQAEAGYARGCYGVGENLYYGPPVLATPRRAVSAWLHSTSHRALLLDPAYEDIGVASARGILGGHEVRLWVVHLGYRC